MADEPQIPKQVLKYADKATAKLKIQDFIEKYKAELIKRILGCEHEASVARANKDTVFLTAAFPIINGIIHVASDRKSLQEATKWLREEWSVEPEEYLDTFSVLLALTLIYVVNHGWRARTAETEEQWKSIMRRMRKLSDEMDPEAEAQ